MSGPKTKRELVLKEGCGVLLRSRKGGTRIVREFVNDTMDGVHIQWAPSQFAGAVDLVMVRGPHDREGKPCEEAEIGAVILADVHSIPMCDVQRISAIDAVVGEQQQRIARPVLVGPNGGGIQ